MKILIFGFTKLKYMPYMKFYLQSLGDTDCELHILSWNRDSEGDILPPDGVTHHEFSRALADERSVFSKIPAFIEYRRFLSEIIKKEKFDFLIVLHTPPGVLINKTLCGKYRNRFIFDYRDYTYERFGWYKRIVAHITEASALTLVSSDGFRRFLPAKPGILTSHNITVEDLNHRDIKHTKSKDGKIRIAFWGYIRHEKINSEIIRKLGADSRFELHYYGREQSTAVKLKKYCLQNGIKNVFFHGQYIPSDRYTFAQNTDIIHNLYDMGGTEEAAVGNKYYDGIVFRIPQICSKGSYMGELVEKNRVGIALDAFDGDFSDSLWEYYNSIEKSTFYAACDSCLCEITNDYKNAAKTVRTTVFA